MKKSMAFLSRIIAGAAAALAVGFFASCQLELGNQDDRASISGYAVTGIEVTNQKTAFTKGSSFEFGTNAVITATKADGSTSVLTADDVTVSGFDSSTVRNITVTVSYKEAVTSYDVSITNAVKSLALKTGDSLYTYSADGTSYLLFGKSAAKLTVTYDDNTTSDIPLSDAELSGIGKDSCTVSYGGKTADIELVNCATVAELVDHSTVAELVGTSAIIDEEIGVADCTTSWVAGKNRTIADGNTSTVYFVNYGSGANVWNNFLIAFGSGASWVTLRADNWGWNFGDAAGSIFDFNRDTGDVDTTESMLPADWAVWNTAISAGVVVKCDVSLAGNIVTFTCTSPSIENWKQVYKFTAKSDVNSVDWHLQIDGAHLFALK